MLYLIILDPVITKSDRRNLKRNKIQLVYFFSYVTLQQRTQLQRTTWERIICRSNTSIHLHISVIQFNADGSILLSCLSHKAHLV